MMTLEQVKEKLQDRNIAEVSRRCNLQYQTVFNIATGRNKNPSYNTVVKLVEYFKGDWNDNIPRFDTGRDFHIIVCCFSYGMRFGWLCLSGVSG